MSAARKMHDDEVDTDASIAHRLLAAQFPQWAELHVQPSPSSQRARGRGWALSVGRNALPYYRVSNTVLARIARRAIDEALADHQRTP